MDQTTHTGPIPTHTEPLPAGWYATHVYGYTMRDWLHVLVVVAYLDGNEPGELNADSYPEELARAQPLLALEDDDEILATVEKLEKAARDVLCIGPRQDVLAASSAVFECGTSLSELIGSHDVYSDPTNDW